MLIPGLCALGLPPLLMMEPGPVIVAWFQDPLVYGSLAFGAAMGLLALALRLHTVLAWFRARKGGTISVGELQSLMLGYAPSIVDLRPLKAFQGPKGFIRGSACIPFAELHRRLDEVDRDPRRAVVLVDESDRLAHRVAPYLRKQGFLTVHVLRGGLRAWRDHALPVHTFRR